jgi:hypothetical protein
MAEALQHGQTAFIAWISATCATDDEPVSDTTRSGRAIDALKSLPKVVANFPGFVRDEFEKIERAQAAKK